MQPDDPHRREVVELNPRRLVIHEVPQMLLQRVYETLLYLLDRPRVHEDPREPLRDTEKGRGIRLALAHIEHAQTELEHGPLQIDTLARPVYSISLFGRLRATTSPNDSPASWSRSFACRARRASPFASRVG